VSCIVPSRGVKTHPIIVDLSIYGIGKGKLMGSSLLERTRFGEYAIKVMFQNRGKGAVDKLKNKGRMGGAEALG